jgi:hypothetical protein
MSPSATATNAASLAPNQPLKRRKQHNTPPSQPTDPLLNHGPPFSHPEAPSAAATSSPTTATNSAATTSKTATRVSSRVQTTATTPRIRHQALNNEQRQSTAQQTPLRKVVRACSSEHVVHSTERLRQPQDPQRRPVQLATPPCPPLLAPLAPVVPYEPTMTSNASSRPATSSTTHPLTTAVSPALPRSGPRTMVLKRRNTLGDPPGQPCNTSQTPCSPLLDPKRAVSPPLTRLDWAEDAESLPTTPLPPRDLSCLRTARVQPFGTLRRRTRRRRAPSNFFSPARIFSHPALPFNVSTQPVITRRHPPGIGPGRPIVTIPFRVAPTLAPSITRLNWDQDPRLADLSRALRALGWTPPC